MGTNVFNQVICTLRCHCGSCTVVGAQKMSVSLPPQVPSWTVHFTAIVPYIAHNTIRSRTNYSLNLPCVHTANTHMSCCQPSWETVSFVRFPFSLQRPLPFRPIRLVRAARFQAEAADAIIQIIHCTLPGGMFPVTGALDMYTASLYQPPPPQSSEKCLSHPR